MIKAKIRVPITIGFVVVAVLAGIAWWLTYNDTTEVSAQEVVQNACDLAEDARNYDFSTVWEGPFDNDLGTPTPQSFHTSVSLSGQNLHLITPFVEYKRVDGSGYYREKLSQDETQDWARSSASEDEDIAAFIKGMGRPHVLPEGNLLCPELGAVSAMGREDVEAPLSRGDSAPRSISTTRYRFTKTINLGTGVGGDTADSRPPSRGARSVATDRASRQTWDMWVDSNGQLVQTRSVLTTPSSGGESETGSGLHSSLKSPA